MGGADRRYPCFRLWVLCVGAVVGIEPFIKYDLALREWERYGLVSDREGSPYVYYHGGLNEWRLDKYLITEEYLAKTTLGGWHLIDSADIRRLAIDSIYTRESTLSVSKGEIIGVKTEGLHEVADGVFARTPGYWIVLNLGQIEIVPGSNTLKPITVDSRET